MSDSTTIVPTAHNDAQHARYESFRLTEHETSAILCVGHPAGTLSVNQAAVGDALKRIPTAIFTATTDTSSIRAVRGKTIDAVRRNVNSKIYLKP